MDFFFLSFVTHSVLSQIEQSLEVLVHPNRIVSLFCVVPGDS